MATAKTPTTKATSLEAEEAITNAEVADVVEEKDEVSTKSVAKAGKRSAKAQAAAEEKAAKEERKAQDPERAPEDAKPKQTHKPARSRLERQGKQFRSKAELVDKSKVYNLKDSLKLATETSPVKFDATVELHINLNVNPRHADQNLRDNLVLPAGTGKNVRVAVFDDAQVEGADISGVEALSKELEKGTINFDVLIATPAQMPKLGKFARLLGPRGLMPNPKSGTVTQDAAKAVNEAKAGRVEYRVDSTGIVHIGIGKVSFGADKLLQNAQAVYASLKANKPASVKGTYVKAIHIATTMGPSITVEPNL